MDERENTQTHEHVEAKGWRDRGGDKIEREYEGNERETDVKTEK